MNKEHRNSVLPDGTVPDEEILETLRHSSVPVTRSPRRADRDRVLAAPGEDVPPVHEGPEQPSEGT
ncbi:hypothetical protein [Nocardiopsis sp. ATB16-24]|uniref:hypothetical protein n=1 Tax=Nocardiopsis sp. ATB16-24 TaxID=3019555 RepID=UPI00331AC6AB